jgi:carbonic anhydrase/acetyltransferase-like protein (isoleucine patch superfamily)
MSAHLRFTLQSTAYIAAIYGLPAAAIVATMSFGSSVVARAIAACAAPMVYAALFVAIAGVLSLPHQKSIVAGKFVRRLSNPAYYDRRIYGLCWTCVYYCKPVYFVALNVPWLKAMTFRIFGYRGDLGFTIYPDTWIRDLPLLHFGENAYIGNRACIGSNQCFGAEHILVDGITVGDGGVVGQLAMIGPGSRVGARAELGAGAAVGMRVQIEARAKVGACAAVSHGATVGERAEICEKAYVGATAAIESGAVVPPAEIVTRGTRFANTRKKRCA